MALPARLMRVLVCGSRGWTDQNVIAGYVTGLPKDAIMIHGGASGADRIAGHIAEARGMKVEVFLPNWQQYGRQAGIMRNNQMLDTKPDLVIAFWDGQSHGTKHTIDEARRRGITCEVVEC